MKSGNQMMRMLLLALLIVTPAAARMPDAIVADPPRDIAHPARMEVLHIPSGGVEVNGVAYQCLVIHHQSRRYAKFGLYPSQITALDNSPEMLRLARARLQHLAADHLALVQGDFTALPFAEAAFDTVLFHQVLHYAQVPELVLAEAARVTRPGGTIAVVDFAAHDREDLRSQHAHARLGFSDEQMLSLLASAGFAAAPPTALPGTPLTVKIWTGQRGSSLSKPTSATKAAAA